MSRSLFPGKLKKGYLIKSPPLDGAAYKKMFKAWKRRWCVLYLSDGKLYFQYYENEEKSHTGCPKNTLLLEECLEITFDLEHHEYDHVFSLTLPERTYYFSAVSEFEMTDWVDKIREPLDLKRATSLKVQKSIRRSATLDTSSNTSSPVISPPSLLFHGGCHTLPTPSSPAGVTITPPLPPPRHPSPSPFNGVTGFCTLPRQPAVKTMSFGSPECPPLPVRSRLRDQNDALPPLPPPHSPLRGRASIDCSSGLVIGSPVNKSTNDIDTIVEAPPLPARPRSCSDESPFCKEINEMVPPLPPKPQQQISTPKPPVIPPRKTSTTDYVNYEILPIPEKRPVPAPRTKKPIAENN